MAPDGQHSGRLAACHAASHNQHLLLSENGLVGHIPLSGCLGIDRAVNHGVLLHSSHASFLTGDAGADTASSSCPQFVHIIRVRQKGTAQADDIALAIFKGFQSHIRVVHTACAEYRHVHHFLYHLTVGTVQPLLLVHRRMIPPPGVVGSHIRIQGVVAVFHQQLGGLKSFFNIPAFFLKLLSRESSLSPILNHALDAEPQGDWEILSAAGLNLLHHLSGKAQTVLQGAAVLIGPLIEHGNGKLVQQVSFMDGVNLHSVKSGPLGIVGAVSEGLDDAVNLLHGQRPADFIQPAVGNGGRRHRRELT